MVISVEDLKLADASFTELDDVILGRKLLAIEQMIRSTTNNNFQLQNARFVADSLDGVLLGKNKYIQAGDTVQVSTTGVNDGLYIVVDVSGNETVIDGDLHDCSNNRVTKVVYPPDVVEGVIKLLRFEIESQGRDNVSSEKLSRHTVSYFDINDNNISGYPPAVLGFLQPHMRIQI